MDSSAIRSKHDSTQLAPIEITGVAQQAAWKAKEFPPVEQVRDGVWSIPVVFAGNPMRYTLSYLLVSANEVLIIDPGWDSDEGLGQIRQVFTDIGLKLDQLTGIIATHFHTDHLGMAARLRDLTGAWVASGANDIIGIQAYKDVADFRQKSLEQLAAWGIPESILDDAAITEKQAQILENLAVPDFLLHDGELVPSANFKLTVIATPGHSPGHICLFDETHQLIFSGDHVLPRITPNIALEREGSGNPLADYYRSLDVIALDDSTEVCPAHEYRFIGMNRRVAQLKEQNRERSAEVLKSYELHGGRTVWEIAKHLTWSRGWDSLNALSLRLAISETASHISYLQQAGHELPIPISPVDHG